MELSTTELRQYINQLTEELHRRESLEEEQALVERLKTEKFVVIYPLSKYGLLTEAHEHCAVDIPIIICSDTRSKYDIEDSAEVSHYDDEPSEWMEALMFNLPEIRPDVEWTKTGKWRYGDRNDAHTAQAYQRMDVWYNPFTLEDERGIGIDYDTCQVIMFVKRGSAYDAFRRISGSTSNVPFKDYPKIQESKEKIVVREGTFLKIDKKYASQIDEDYIYSIIPI